MYYTAGRRILTAFLVLWLGVASFQLAVRIPSTGRFIIHPDRNRHRHNYQFVRLRNNISGLDFQVDFNEKLLFNIRADNMGIQNKRFGFFRFALIKQILIQNARLAFFSVNSKRIKTAKSPVIPATGNPKQDRTIVQRQGLNFISVLYPGLRISGVIMEPVSWAITKGNGQKAVITANHASLDLKHNLVIFNGNVKLTAPGNHLETNSMQFDPVHNQIEVSGRYFLQKKRQIIQGRGLRSNIYLHADL